MFVKESDKPLVLRPYDNNTDDYDVGPMGETIEEVTRVGPPTPAHVRGRSSHHPDEVLET